MQAVLMHWFSWLVEGSGFTWWSWSLATVAAAALATVIGQLGQMCRTLSGAAMQATLCPPDAAVRPNRRRPSPEGAPAPQGTTTSS